MSSSSMNSPQRAQSTPGGLSPESGSPSKRKTKRQMTQEERLAEYEAKEEERRKAEETQEYIKYLREHA